MDVDQEIIPYCNGNQVAFDFTDQLPSGFRFQPTDSELIVDYLNAKIKSTEHPKFRLHEVNIYNHKPEELAERYRSHENKWYFLTPRDRDPGVNRPYRSVGQLGQFGFWKTTQRQKPVYDATRIMVGNKRTLAFIVNGCKTMWLMHEYTTNGPNLPFENRENGNKLNEWVLCKIYKNETNFSKEVMEESNGSPGIPFRKRRRVSENSETNFSNHHEQLDVQMVTPIKIQRLVSENSETNFSNHHEQLDVQMVTPIKIQRLVNESDTRGQLTAPMGSAHTLVNQGFGYSNGDIVGQIRTNTNPYPFPMQLMTRFQDLNLIQHEAPCYKNQITSNASNSFQFSDGASSSCSSEPPAVIAKQHVFQKSYEDPNSQLNVQSGSNHSIVMPSDAADDHIPQGLTIGSIISNLSILQI